VAGACGSAVYERSSLHLRAFEAVRINSCAICTGWRTARDVPGWEASPDVVPEEFYDRAGLDPGRKGFSDRERLAAELAQRYAEDHLGMDDASWDRPHRHFFDGEGVDLALCVGPWLAPSRFNQVFDIAGACRDLPPAAR
jgi:hypothetical protein